jgi:hypothetical protein
MVKASSREEGPRKGAIWFKSSELAGSFFVMLGGVKTKDVLSLA